MKFVDASGRGIGESYIPNCSLNALIQDKYAPNSNEHQFRYALQRNAEKIMKDLSAVDKEFKLCPVCKKALEYKPMGNILPKQTQFGLQPNPNSLTN